MSKIFDFRIRNSESIAEWHSHGAAVPASEAFTQFEAATGTALPDPRHEEADRPGAPSPGTTGALGARRQEVPGDGGMYCI